MKIFLTAIFVYGLLLLSADYLFPPRPPGDPRGYSITIDTETIKIKTMTGYPWDLTKSARTWDGTLLLKFKHPSLDAIRLSDIKSVADKRDYVQVLLWRSIKLSEIYEQVNPSVTVYRKELNLWEVKDGFPDLDRFEYYANIESENVSDVIVCSKDGMARNPTCRHHFHYFDGIFAQVIYNKRNLLPFWREIKSSVYRVAIKETL